MSTSDSIQPLHRSRLAIVSIRQSSPHQALANKESLELQYRLRDRARAAGWDPSQVRIIDADLGRSGRTKAGRPAFPELVRLVNLGQVGIVLAYDVTRLARNCTDWYQLLDLCGWRSCLVADQDGIYDPVTPNGRLILGLKGLISELELHRLRARLTAALRNKAQRGERALPLRIGLVRDRLGQVHKRPDEEVQRRLALVFATFLQRKAACRVVRYLDPHDLLLPRKGRFGDLVWRKPTTAAVLSILKNPADAGAVVYGRTRTVPKAGAAHERTQHALPMAQWKICLRDRYPASIDWATFAIIQDMIRDNHSDYDRNQSRGIPRPGKALLHGIVYCGACGHKRVVQYKKGTHYICNYLRQQYPVPVCQHLPADPIDAGVVGAFFDVLSPVELDLYDQALRALRPDDEQLRQAQQQQRQRLRYQARWAERQFHQADADNRLGTAELERRWEAALRELQQAEEKAPAEPQQPSTPDTLSAADNEAFRRAGQDIPALWRQRRLSPPPPKAFLRCLIDKIVVHRSAPDTLQVRIVWRGGDTTAKVLPVTVGSLARLSVADDMEREILELATEGKSDEEIATLLSKKGYHSTKHDTVLPSTVRLVRRRHRLFRQRSQSQPRHISGYRTVPQLAHRLGIKPAWLYHQIHNGAIQIARDADTNLYLFPDHADTIARFEQLRAGTLEKLRL